MSSGYHGTTSVNNTMYVTAALLPAPRAEMQLHVSGVFRVPRFAPARYHAPFGRG
jgi:hypothetical protein